jgi:hypothetical protein
MTAVVVDNGQALRVGRPADLDVFEVVGGQTAKNGAAYLAALDDYNPRCNGIAYGAPCVSEWTDGDSS